MSPGRTFRRGAPLTTAGNDAALQVAFQASYPFMLGHVPASTTCTRPDVATCMATMEEFRACLDDVATASDQGLDDLQTCPELTG